MQGVLYEIAFGQNVVTHLVVTCLGVKRPVRIDQVSCVDVNRICQHCVAPNSIEAIRQRRLGPQQSNRWRVIRPGNLGVSGKPRPNHSELNSWLDSWLDQNKFIGTVDITFAE
jgi:hypothetical protein